MDDTPKGTEELEGAEARRVRYRKDPEYRGRVLKYTEDWKKRHDYQAKARQRYKEDHEFRRSERERKYKYWQENKEALKKKRRERYRQLKIERDGGIPVEMKEEQK